MLRNKKTLEIHSKAWRIDSIICQSFLNESKVWFLIETALLILNWCCKKFLYPVIDGSLFASLQVNMNFLRYRITKFVKVSSAPKIMLISSIVNSILLPFKKLHKVTKKNIHIFTFPKKMLNCFWVCLTKGA